MAHSFIDHNIEISSSKFVENFKLALQFFLLLTAFFLAKEVRMQGVHEEIADFEHIPVDFTF